MISFYLLATVMIIGALGVISLRQPVHAALALVGTLLTLAITYVTLEAHFLATVQVIVYAGAIMVLFLFVIMLLNVSEEGSSKLDWLPPAAYITAAIAIFAIITMTRQDAPAVPEAAVVSATLQGGGAEQIGTALFSHYVLAFQLVGVLLLTGIVAAVSLVQRKLEDIAAKEAQRKMLEPSTGASPLSASAHATPDTVKELANA